jgi:hypothetical protein
MIPDLVMKILKIEPVVFFGPTTDTEPTALNKDQVFANKDELKLSRP